MREFDWIARHFAPLAEGCEAALGLKDDAALISLSGPRDLAVTTDAMVADRHFRTGDPPDLIARKLMRVNLSDLAAMGAEPAYGFLTTAWPLGTEEDVVARFAQGLDADRKAFGLPIAGGDTVGTEGPLTLSLTVLGWVETGQALLRSGAKPGDDFYVSGTIGDGGLGLAVLQGELPALGQPHADDLAGRYHLPQPRLALGRALSGLASAALDVSDGLVQDAGHMARASGVDLTLEIGRVPVSTAAQAALDAGLSGRKALITAGDDYELLFTAAPDRAQEIEARAQHAGVPVTRIGTVTDRSGDQPAVRVLDAEGEPITLERGGFSHF